MQSNFTTFRKLRWQLTLRHSAVTVSALFVVVLILGALLLSRVMLPLDVFNTSFTPAAWIQMERNDAPDLLQHILTQDPIDTDLVSKLLPLGDILENRILWNLVFAILLSWVCNRTNGSILAPVLFHPSMNAFGNNLGGLNFQAISSSAWLSSPSSSTRCGRSCPPTTRRCNHLLTDRFRTPRTPRRAVRRPWRHEFVDQAWNLLRRFYLISKGLENLLSIPMMSPS